MSKKYLTKCAGKHRIKRKVKKTNTKPVLVKKKSLDNRLLTCAADIIVCKAKINELVKNTNEGLEKICNVMDEHEKAIKHFIASQTTMQDAIKSLTTQINLIMCNVKKKEGG